MKRQSLLLTLLVLLMISISACGILQEPEAASAPIEAVPLDVTDTAGQEEMDDADTTTAADANADENEVDDSEEMEESATEEPAVVEEPATSGIVIYQISPEASQVRFELDEDLRGNRITVVGSTDQVAGEIGHSGTVPSVIRVNSSDVRAFSD